MLIYLTNTLVNALGDAVNQAIGAAFWLLIFGLIISLAVFCLFVAVGTYVVKKVWFSNWGGNPRRYR